MADIDWQKDYECRLYCAISDLKRFEKHRRKTGQTVKEYFMNRAEEIYSNKNGHKVGVVPLEMEDTFYSAMIDFKYICKKLELDPAETLKKNGLEVLDL